MKINNGFAKRALAFLLCAVMLFGSAPLNGLAVLDFSRLDAFNMDFTPVKSFFGKLADIRLPGLFGTKAAAEGELPVSGYCGYDSDGDGEPDDNITWEYSDSTKTLYINGVGEMQNYSLQNPAPWSVYKDVIETIYIGTITTLGDYAFFNFANYSLSGYIPSSGTYSIGGTVTSDMLWQFDTGLHKLSVEGSGAIPDYSAVDPAPWSGLIYLCGEIEIDSSITAIGDYAFFVNYDWYSLQELNIPQSVVSIGDYAFYGACLQRVNIPQTVTSVGENVFGGFGFDHSDGTAFADVWTYDYSQKVLYIGNEYPSQTGNYSPDDPAPWYAFRNEVESIEFSEFAEVYVGDYAFYDFTALKDLYIPSNVRSLGAYSFGRSFDPYDDSNFEWSLSTDIMNNSSYPTIYYLDVGILMQGLEKIFIDSTVSEGISETAFDNCFSLEEVYCRGSSFPSSVNSGSWTVNAIDRLRDTYKNYCNNYLSRQPALTVLDSSSLNQLINILQFFSSNEALIDRLENTVIYSCDSKLYVPRYPNPDPNDFYGLGIITVHTDCTMMGKNGSSFWHVENGILYIIGSGVCGDGENPYFDNNTVSGCDLYNIETIYFSDDITAIADNAFCNLNNIKYVRSSDGVQSIGKNAFGTPSGSFSNYNYANYFVYNNVCYGYERFEYSSEYYIACYDDSAWDDTEPVSIVKEWWIINARVDIDYAVKRDTTIIAGGAFEGNNGLTTVTIPNSVNRICKDAFNGCDYLETVCYSGTDVDWNNIVIEEGNEPLLNAQRIRAPFIVAVSTNGGWSNSGCTGFCEWNEDETIAMTISAEEYYPGRMTITDVAFDEYSDIDITQKITSLTINAPVEGVSTAAFQGLTNLESITLPGTLRSMNADAFDGTAYYNNEENWENGVLYIGDCLVKADSSVSGEYTVKDGTRLIADSAFENCEGLTGITVPDGVEIIGASAFENCVNLENITLPDSLVNIGKNAFANTGFYNNNENWTVTNIGDRELYIGSNLIYVDTSYSTRNYSVVEDNVKCVAEGAFPKSTQNIHYDLYILNTATVFSDYALSGWGENSNSESRIYYYGTNADWQNSNSRIYTYSSVWRFVLEGGYFGTSGSKITGVSQELRVLKIPEELNGTSLTAIDSNVCKGYTIDSLYIPKRTTGSNEFTIGYSAFADCRNLSYMFIDVNLKTVLQLALFKNVGSDTDGVEMVFGKNVQRTGIGPMIFGAFNINANIKKLVIMSEDIQSIGTWGLALKNLRTAGPLGGGYDFEFGWEENIPAEAFSICSNLTEITIPASVKNIGSSAFGSCGSNTEVYYGGTVYDWCRISFADATANPAAEANVFINGTNISETTGIDAADLDGMTKINNYTFYNWSGLESIDIPGTVTSIGDSAFYGCTGLEHVIIPDSVETIGNYAFYDCRNIFVLNVPATVTSIGSKVFIGSKAFYDISNVVYEGNATGSPWGAKAVNGYIRDYENPEGGKYRLVFKDKDRTVLLGCSTDATGTVTVPGSVDFVGDRAFANCSRIEKIIYNAGEPDYGKNVYAGCTAVIEYTTTEVLAKDVIFSDEGTRLIFCSKARDGKYSVPDGVEVIEDYAFAKCEKIKAAIPEDNSILSVGTNAFFNTPETQKTITATAPDENGVYYELTLIGTILLDVVPKLPETSGDEGETGEDESGEDEEQEFILDLSDTGITCIAAGALANCSDVTKVVLPGSIKGISHNAFDGCANLETIDGGANLKYVGKDAFSGTKFYSDWADGNEKALYIGGCLVKVRPTASGNFAVASGKTCIADSALEGCESVTKVTVPEGVTRIGNRAFAGCKGLTSIELPGGLEVIESEAFEGCTALTSVELPATLTRLGGRVFLGCTALESITVTGNTENPVFVSSDGVLFRNKTTDENKTEKHLVVYPSAKTDADYEIPAGKADVFDNFAFAYCNNLNSVTFHGVSYRTVAFYECDAARISDNLKDGVELSEDGTMLMQVTADALDENGSFTVPEGIIAISGAAFRSIKEQLKGIDLYGALIINDDAFRGCVILESVNGSEGVVHVGANAFNGCAKLGGIDLRGAETICGGAFSGCTLLDNENTVISGKAIVAKDAFDFEIDSNINIVTYSSGSATGSAVPDDLIITVDYGGNVTLNCSTEISLESSNGIIRRIAWVNAETGEMLDGDGDGVTIENLKGDIEVKAVIYEENGNPEDVELLAESEPVKITVGSIPVEINNGESSVTCEFCSMLNLTLPENMADGTITWYKYVDGGTPEAMNIDEPVTQDITVYASIEKDGRTYKSQNIEVNVKPPEIDYTETGTEELELKTVTLSVNLSDKESGSRISDAIAGKFTFEWYKDGKKVGEGTEHTFRNVSKSFDVTVKVKFNGTEIDEYKYTVNIKEQTVIVNEPSIKVVNTGKTKTVDLKSTVTFTADVKYKPDDAKIQWYKDGKAVKGENGKTFKVEKAESDYTVQAKLVDATGKELCKSETQTVKVKTGFLAIIIAFFRQIFGRLPDVKWEEVK